ERAGWDGFFVWDTILFKAKGLPVGERWGTLAAVAMRTERMRIGRVVAPLPRRRRWQGAREAVAGDLLAQGRLVREGGLGGGGGGPSLGKRRDGEGDPGGKGV